MYNFTLTALLLVSFSFSGIGQSPLDPVFTTFKGPVYKMPVIKAKAKNGKGTKYGLQERFGDFVYDYKVLLEIELESLDVPDTDYREGFPGHPKLVTQYAMLLDTEVTIKQKACYEFQLNSDDGSILWIDEEMIVDNDGGHGMRLKKDSVVLDAGVYPAKVWYFQSYATQFGIEFDYKYLGPPSVCPADKEELVKIDWHSSYLFDSGSFELKSDAATDLKSLCSSISSATPKKVSVIGHTDNVGSSQANQILSLKRAQTISKALKNCLSHLDVEFHSTGKGDTEPLVDNKSAINRTKNRRVEIIIEQ